MPALGADMESGTVVEWLVGPGDEVHRGDAVAVVDTEKSLIDVECFESGTVERLIVPAGGKVPVGAPLAVIATAGAAPPPPPAAPPAIPEPRTPPDVAGPTPVAPPEPAAPVRSPLTRKRAAEAGLDLAAVPATGPHGEITRADVERAAHRPRLTPYARRLARERGLDPASVAAAVRGPVRARDLPAAPLAASPVTASPGAAAPDPRRAVVARLMARSKREIPHYYLSTEIELGAALERLRARNREVPVTERVLPAALLLHAVARAATAVPALNGYWVDDRFVPGDGVHLGFAVALRGGGLAVPVLRDADRLSLDGLMAAMLGAAGRARTGHLRSSEASGATLTVTHLGDLGVDAVSGVIFPPQVALVGLGATRPRPWADGDAVVVRPVVTATLSGDHRATDGATGARFLHAIDEALHRPEGEP
jgi:pyruvate dehydrogenase E2 component (dihydrolipoamide acetyltransferase)